MSILSNGKLNDLNIPVPSREKQEEIGSYFEKTIKNRVLLSKMKFTVDDNDEEHDGESDEDAVMEEIR